ncbi:MAG TPA: hypothetical protein VFC00_34520 [Micromonosporaceae bacterium]|nr:hypothetical protein [Micromonosporaceae bacterium]
MSKRTRNMLIIALVLFLCCFGGSIANPFSSDNEDDNPIVNLLGKFASKNVVPDSDVTAACKNAANTFTVNLTPCVLSVPASDTEIRNLILSSNVTFTVEARVPRGDDTGEAKAKRDDADGRFRIKVAIDERGGQVVLTCNCVVKREDGS